VRLFANTVHTRDGGGHVDGVFLALRKALSSLTGRKLQTPRRPQMRARAPNALCGMAFVHKSRCFGRDFQEGIAERSKTG